MGAFDYPQPVASRRHGPRGYADYSYFRPWLRDEFAFRCRYCLRREQWGLQRGEFDVDHLLPQSSHPDLVADYHNLAYACRRCNLTKGDRIVPDPVACLIQGSVRIRKDGDIQASTQEAQALIEKLDLNSPEITAWRKMWIDNVNLAKQIDPDQYRRLLGFPADLPKLSRLRPPGRNSRPEGIEESYYAQRERGELPDVY